MIMVHYDESQGAEAVRQQGVVRRHSADSEGAAGESGRLKPEEPRSISGHGQPLRSTARASCQSGNLREAII